MSLGKTLFWFWKASLWHDLLVKKIKTIYYNIIIGIDKQYGTDYMFNRSSKKGEDLNKGNNYGRNRIGDRALKLVKARMILTAFLGEGQYDKMSRQQTLNFTR